jgi:hypothetical protein
MMRAGICDTLKSQALHLLESFLSIGVTCIRRKSIYTASLILSTICRRSLSDRDVRIHAIQGDSKNDKGVRAIREHGEAKMPG